MDNIVLKEKRKNLFSLSANALELYVNDSFLNITHFFNESDLLQFIENKAINELKINKASMFERIKSFIDPVNDTKQLNDALLILDYDSEFKNTKDITTLKNELIEAIVAKRINELDKLIENSLQAKINYYDTSI
jgi:hypothetical protein